MIGLVVCAIPRAKTHVCDQKVSSFNFSHVNLWKGYWVHCSE